MPRLLLILCLLFNVLVVSRSLAQKNQNPKQISNLVSVLDHDTCLDKKFSIVFYVVLDSNYTPMTATPSMLASIIDTLNEKFKPICVSFANCSTVFIPNFTYNRWYRNTTDPQVTPSWHTDKTINFFIVDSIKDATVYERGYADPPPSSATVTPKDVIVVEQFRTTPPYSSLDYYHVIHAMGHFFGLSHTFDELNPNSPASPLPVSPVVSQEFADGSNSPFHGDMLQDTEADPGPLLQEYDGKGDRYIRPLDNYMSFLSIACKFSQQQYNLMAKNILTKRLYLH
jgi:hypothetical protein